MLLKNEGELVVTFTELSVAYMYPSEVYVVTVK